MINFALFKEVIDSTITDDGIGAKLPLSKKFFLLNPKNKKKYEINYLYSLKNLDLNDYCDTLFDPKHKITVSGEETNFQVIHDSSLLQEKLDTLIVLYGYYLKKSQIKLANDVITKLKTLFNSSAILDGQLSLCKLYAKKVLNDISSEINANNVIVAINDLIGKKELNSAISLLTLLTEMNIWQGSFRFAQLYKNEYQKSASPVDTATQYLKAYHLANNTEDKSIVYKEFQDFANNKKADEEVQRLFQQCDTQHTIPGLQQLINEKKFTDCAKALDDAIAKDKQNPQLQLMRGVAYKNAYEGITDFDNAISCFSNAIKLAHSQKNEKLIQEANKELFDIATSPFSGAVQKAVAALLEQYSAFDQSFVKFFNQFKNKHLETLERKMLTFFENIKEKPDLQIIIELFRDCKNETLRTSIINAYFTEKTYVKSFENDLVVQENKLAISLIVSRLKNNIYDIARCKDLYSSKNKEIASAAYNSFIFKISAEKNINDESVKFVISLLDSNNQDIVESIEISLLPKCDVDRLKMFIDSCKNSRIQRAATVQYCLVISSLTERFPSFPEVATLLSFAKNAIPEVHFALGRIYASEKSHFLDTDKAIEFYKEAISLGYEPAAEELFKYYPSIHQTRSKLKSEDRPKKLLDWGFKEALKKIHKEGTGTNVYGFKKLFNCYLAHQRYDLSQEAQLYLHILTIISSNKQNSLLNEETEYDTAIKGLKSLLTTVDDKFLVPLQEVVKKISENKLVDQTILELIKKRIQELMPIKQKETSSSNIFKGFFFSGKPQSPGNKNLSMETEEKKTPKETKKNSNDEKLQETKTILKPHMPEPSAPPANLVKPGRIFTQTKEIIMSSKEAVLEKTELNNWKRTSF